MGAWSPYKVASFKMELIGAKEIPRPPIDLTGIPGSSKLYRFTGPEEQPPRLGVCVGVQTAVEGSVEVANGERELVPNASFLAAEG